MTPISDIEFSLFNNLKDVKPQRITLFNLYWEIKKCKVESLIKKVRAQKDKKERDKLKAKNLPSVTLSGVFEGGHGKVNFVEASFLMQIDFDGVDTAQTMRTLVGDPHTALAFISPSGTGIKGVVRYEGEHLAAFEALEAYYLEQYGLVMDKNCKDISRLCYLSADPDVYYNPDAQIFVFEAKQKKAAKPPALPPAKRRQTGARRSAEEMLQEAIGRLGGTDITGTYEDWMKCAMALGSEFGEAGRAYFHALSRNYPEYSPKECDRKYDDILKNPAREVTIAYLFHRLQDFGIMNRAGDAAGKRGRRKDAPPPDVQDIPPPVKKDKNEPQPINPQTGKPYTRDEIKKLHNFYTFSKDKSGEIKLRLKRIHIIKMLKKFGYSIYQNDNLDIAFVKV